MNPLHAAVVGVAALLLVALAGGLVLCAGPVFGPLRSAGAGPFLALAALLAGHALILKPGLPHNVWHEQHAGGLLTVVDGPLGFGGLEGTHGPVYTLVLKGARALLPGSPPVFDLNYLFAAVSVVLMFLLLQTLFGEAALSLTGAAMLLFLPVHMRLSTTESMFVIAEAALLLAAILFAAWVRTRSGPLFVLGAAAGLVAMHSRGELMVLVPAAATAALVILRRRLPSAALGDPWVRGGLALAAALAAPRVLELALMGDSRVVRFAPSLNDSQFWGLGFAGSNAFFNPEWTPRVYPWLFLLGIAALGLRSPAGAAAVSAALVPTVYFYCLHLSCVSLKVRSALATQFLFVGVAAYGVHALLGRLPRLPRAAGYALVAAFVLSVPGRRRAFLSELFVSQKEFLFLERAARALPPESAVVFLSDDDGEEPSLQTRTNAHDFLRRSARDLGKEVAAMSVSGFSGVKDTASLADVYFYEGTQCATIPWSAKSPRKDMGTRPDYLHPSCLAMREGFVLEPVVRERVSGRSLSWDAMEGGERELTLYRVAARADGRPLGGGGPAPVSSSGDLPAIQAFKRSLRLFDERRAEFGDRQAIRIFKRSLRLFDEGRAVDAFAAYHEAVPIAMPERSDTVVAYCGARPDECAAFEAARSRLAALIDEGLKAFGAGRPDEAARHFDAALALDPWDLDALLNAAAMAVGRGDPAAAVGFYDRAIALKPAAPGLLDRLIVDRADAGRAILR